MRSAYTVQGVNSTTVRALNYTPEIETMRNLWAWASPLR